MIRKATNPKELTYTIRDDDGKVIDKFVLKVPTGSVGWKHFRILMELENARRQGIKEWRKDTRQFITVTKEDPKTKEWKEVIIENPTFNKDIEVELPNPKLDEVMEKVMDRWITEILPEVIVSHEFEQIEWTHLLQLFEVVCKNASVDTANFRADN